MGANGNAAVPNATSSSSSSSLLENNNNNNNNRQGDGDGGSDGGSVNKLFVGGLPQDITDTEFREFFGKFGDIRESVVKFDPQNGLPRGFGFITFVDPDIASFVTKLGDKCEGYGRLVMRGKTCEIKSHRENRNKLFVGGLPLDITNLELRDFFQQFGVVIDSIVMVRKDTNIPRGFFFVTFADPDVTDFVLKMRDNHGSTRDGIGQIVMRGTVCEIKVYDSHSDGHNDDAHPSSSAGGGTGKRSRENEGNNSSGRGSFHTMKVTTNVHDMNEQERLPHDYELPRAITEYRSSTDVVCFSDRNKETSFPYSAVRKVYFCNLLFGSRYYCHEMEQEKRKQESESDSSGNQYQHEQDYHRRPVVHRDDPMVIVSSSSARCHGGTHYMPHLWWCTPQGKMLGSPNECTFTS